MLGEVNLLAGPGLRFVIRQFFFGNGPELVAEVREGVEECRVGVAHHVSATCWQEHEGGCCLCVQEG